VSLLVSVDCIPLTGPRSVNDILDIEVEGSGTQFEANNSSKDAFMTLVDGDQWMIYRNALTNVLHWDFVRLHVPFHYTFV
jgi:hypothetical protein